MLLATQIQAILYAFLIGIVYAILFSFKQYMTSFLKSKIKIGMIDILYHVLFILSAYYGLFHINGGISNLYLYVLFFIGIYLFYLLYYEVFLTFYNFLILKIKPMYRKYYLLYTKYYSIMFIDKKERRHGKKKSKKTNKSN